MVKIQNKWYRPLKSTAYTSLKIPIKFKFFTSLSLNFENLSSRNVLRIENRPIVNVLKIETSVFQGVGLLVLDTWIALMAVISRKIGVEHLSFPYVWLNYLTKIVNGYLQEENHVRWQLYDESLLWLSTRHSKGFKRNPIFNRLKAQKLDYRENYENPTQLWL